MKQAQSQAAKQGLKNYDQATKDMSIARMELSNAKAQLNRLLRDNRLKKIWDKRNESENMRDAADQIKQAEDALEFAKKRARSELRKTNGDYQAAVGTLAGLERVYTRVKTDIKSTNEQRTEAMNNVHQAEIHVTRMEHQHFAGNDRITIALAQVEDARRNLRDQKKWQTTGNQDGPNQEFIGAWERIQDAQIKLAETERRIYLSKFIIQTATVDRRTIGSGKIQQARDGKSGNKKSRKRKSRYRFD